MSTWAWIAPAAAPSDPALDDVAQDRQTNRVPERPELLGVAFQFSLTLVLLDYSK